MSLWDVIRQIWTIMRHSIVQAMRMKIALVLAIFLVVLVPALPFLLKSDQTHSGQIRLIITYSLYLTSFLLSVLTLFLSVATLNSEIKGQHIFLLDPKPIPRYALLLGKWGGVMLINLVLLIGMLGATYGLVRYYGRRQPNEPQPVYENLKAQLLTARQVQQPPLPDNLGQKVQEAIDQAKKQNMMPATKSEDWVRTRLYEQYSKSAWYLKSGQTMKWTISDVPKFDGWLVIQFQFYGDSGKREHELPCQFVVSEESPYEQRVPEEGPYVAYRVGKRNSFAVRSNVVQDDGTVTIRFTNLDPSVGAMFPYQGGIQVLYPAATLAENFARAGIMMFARLALIAVVGVFASTFLSFPVGVLFSLFVFMVGHMRNYVVTEMLEDLFVFGSSMVQPGTPMHAGDTFLRHALYRMLSIFPNFGAYDVVPFLSGGVVIDRMFVARVLIDLVLIRGGILAVAAWYIYRRRELAALTPQS